MISINPYLSFQGNCEEAFNFYKSVFGGEFQFIGRYKDLPPSERNNFGSVSDEKIMHVSLPISGGTILMGCDSPEPSGLATKSASNISLSLNTDTKPEADRLFNGLSAGGQVKMPMNETFWGAYFGVLTDKFGVDWMISFETKRD